MKWNTDNFESLQDGPPVTLTIQRTDGTRYTARAWAVGDGPPEFSNPEDASFTPILKPGETLLAWHPDGDADKTGITPYDPENPDAPSKTIEQHRASIHVAKKALREAEARLESTLQAFADEHARFKVGEIVEIPEPSDSIGYAPFAGKKCRITQTKGELPYIPSHTKLGITYYGVVLNKDGNDSVNQTTVWAESVDVP